MLRSEGGYDVAKLIFQENQTIDKQNVLQITFLKKHFDSFKMI